MSDREAFGRVMAVLGTTYKGQFSTKDEIEVWWRFFKDRDIRDFGRAVMDHMTTPGKGQWPPKPSDIIGLLDGVPLSADELLAEARLARTALGVLARAHIGTHDLSTGSPQYLRQRAFEAVALQSEWREKIRAGDFTDHELALLEKRGIEPTRRLQNDSGKT